MIYSNPFGALAICAGFIHGTVALTHGLVENHNNIGRTLVARQDATATCLAAKSIATGSFSDGKGQGDGAAANDAPSETDKANFINAGCDGKTLTNGLQNEQGSCNPIPMGDIPSVANMVTTIILSPAPGEDLEPNKDFEIKLRIGSLVAGSFTNPQKTYYSAPQRLDKTGRIIGHVHVTVQELIGSLTPQTPPDPNSVVHFKGIDNAADGNGELTDIVPGLPPGFYRVCTMASASNHQPVIMPVAKRGAQDDCTKITVGQGGGANSGNANGAGANGGGNNSGGANGGGANGGGATGGGANRGRANGGGANVAGSNGGTSGASNSSAQVGAGKF